MTILKKSQNPRNRNQSSYHPMHSLKMSKLGTRLILTAALFFAPGYALAGSCDWQTVESKIGVLKRDGFSYTVVYADYHPPHVDEARSVPSKTKELIHSAFAIAPRFFQYRLCGLENLFIIIDGTETAWGFREHPRRFAPDKQPTRFNEYLAIFNHVPQFNVYETWNFNGLLNPTYPDNLTVSLKNKILPDREANKKNDNILHVLAVLGILAHEEGHIFYQQHYSKVPGDPPFDPNDICDGQFFSGSWKDPDYRMSRAFNVQRSEHLRGIQTSDILNQIATSTNTETGRYLAGQMVANMLQSGDWISLMATFTPEHDWVENYRFAIMEQAQEKLLATPTEIQTGKQDKWVVDPLKSLHQHDNEAARKFKCMSDYITRQKTD